MHLKNLVLLTLCMTIVLIQAQPDEGSPPEIDTNVFDDIDTDKDGKISREEAAAYFLLHDEEAPPLDEIWAEEDKDGDGFIS